MATTPIDFFAALASDARLRCLMLLMEHQELCVCELTHATGLAQPHISRHLAQMRELGLVADRRQGLWVYYRIHPDLPAWALGVLSETQTGLTQQVPFVCDAQTLAAMPNRPSASRCA